MSGKAFDPTLYLVIDPDHCFPCSPEEVAFQAIQGGVSVLQLRSKIASTRDFVALAERIKSIAERFNIPFLINDRTDVALAIGASGVHLVQADLHPEHARGLLGEAALIGFSVSTVDQAKSAQGLPIDYMGVGPVFPTQTKEDCATLSSLEDLKGICEITSQPVVAIGGIDFYNAKLVRNAGVAGIAIVSAICGQADPAGAARRLRETFAT